MNIRQKYELKMLAVDGYVNMTKVAEMFSINLRTVRYDIGILNEFLLRELGRECIFVTNKTAQVDGDVKGQLAGLAEVGVKDFYTDRLTGEERMLLIVLVQRLQHHPGHCGQIFCQPDHGERGYGGGQGVLPEKRH